MIKSARNVQLDKDLIKFLIKSVQRKPFSSNLDTLFTYTMRLDDKVRQYVGQSKSDLKSFLSMFTNELYVDSEERVFLVGKDGAPQINDLSSEAEKLEKSDKPLLDPVILQATGSIYRILGKYGFIELHPPYNGKVYFDGRHVEDGRHTFLIDYGYKEGMKVKIDAVPGPESAEASYRAKHVRRLSSSEFSGDSSPMKSEPINVIVDKSGKIAQVFDQYGFISRTAHKIDDVFFFMNTIVTPEGKQMTSPLSDVLKPGMEAKFDARPNHRQDSQNSWYATRVWIAGISDRGEGLSSSFQTNNGSVDAIDDVHDHGIYISDEDDDEHAPDLNHNDLPATISEESGYLTPIDDSKGVILFGKNCKHKAYYVSEVVRVDSKKVEDQAWRFEGGHEVNFNAQLVNVKNEFGIIERKALVTLAWVGVKPPAIELPISNLYPIYNDRHKFILYDPFILNSLPSKLDQNQDKNVPEMDLLDEYIAGKYPRGFDEEPNEIFGAQGMATNGFLPHNGSSTQWDLLPRTITSPYSNNHQPAYPVDFDGWTSLLGPNSDEMKRWKNSTLEDGIGALSLVNSASQTTQAANENMSSVMSQTVEPITAHDSTQTSRTRTREKLCSTSDLLSIKSTGCQTDEVGPSLVSNGCQTNVSVGWEKLDNEWLLKEMDNQNVRPNDKSKEFVQHCPRCHHIYKS